MNLMSVYLDAVFKPRCVTKEGEWVMKQEGWRYDVNDEGDLEVQGVVFSEMKGVYSNPLSVLDQYTDALLFQDNTYAHDSGGNPTDIPKLTHEEFVDFYKKHYHPTNSQIFISGEKHDVEDGMDLIDSYLSLYELNLDAKINSQIEFQKKRFTHHVYQSYPYAVQKLLEDEGQHMFCITWLLNDDHFQAVDEIGWYVLDFLLFGAASSPLRKALTDSGLGTIIGNGLSTGLLQNTFAVGMKGVKHENVIVVEEKILLILEDIVLKGFDQDDIEAAMNSIEFQLREVNNGDDPSGINVFLSILSKWNYDESPEDAIDYEQPLKVLKTIVEQKGSDIFTDMIQLYLLDNNHRVHIELSPSETYESEMNEKERNALKAFQNSLTHEELNKVIENAKYLHNLQDSLDPPEVVDSIPSLKLEDIDKVGLEYEINLVENAYGTQASVATNVVNASSGIVYIDVGIDVSSLSYADVSILPFLLTILEENDTSSKTRLELDRLEGMFTGGIDIQLVLSPLYGEDRIVTPNSKEMLSHVFFRGKCVAEKADKLLNLIKLLISESMMISSDEAIQILGNQISSYESSMSSQGHSFSMMRMHARYDVIAFIEEQLYGLSQLMTLKSLLDDAKSNWTHVNRRMKNILNDFANKSSKDLIINLTGDSNSLIMIDGFIRDFVKSFPSSSINASSHSRDHPWLEGASKIQNTESPVQNEAIPISSQVSYVGLGGPFYGKGEILEGDSCVPLQFLKKGYLWDEVRAKNGAYGVMASLDKNDGSLFMVSYRDPNISKTLDAYKAASGYLRDELESGSITKKTIDTAIIGCIGALDGSTLPPQDIGWLTFRRMLQKSSPQSRQRWRDGILTANRSSFASFADKLKTWSTKSSVAIVASETMLSDSTKSLNLIFIE
jgi:presequence protease